MFPSSMGRKLAAVRVGKFGDSEHVQQLDLEELEANLHELADTVIGLGSHVVGLSERIGKLEENLTVQRSQV